MNDPHAHPPSASQGHESAVLNVGRLLLWAGGLGALIIASLALTWGMWAWLRAGAPQQPLSWEAGTSEPVHPATGDPPLEPQQVRQRLRYERGQQEQLSGYGWVDRRAGIAHIPIERAMEIYRRQAGETDER